MKKLIFSLGLLMAGAIIFYACQKNNNTPAAEAGQQPITAQRTLLQQSMRVNNVIIPVGTEQIKNADGTITLVLPKGYKAVGIAEKSTPGAGLAESGVAVEADTVTISCECLSTTGKCYPVVAGGSVYSCSTKEPDLCASCLLRTKKGAATSNDRSLQTYFNLEAIVNFNAPTEFVKSAASLPNEIHTPAVLMQVPEFKARVNQLLNGRFTPADLAVLNRTATTGGLPANYKLRAISIMGNLAVVALNTDMAVNATATTAANDTTINGVTYSCKCSSGTTGCTLKVLQGQVPIVECTPGDCTVCAMSVSRPKKQEEETQNL